MWGGSFNNTKACWYIELKNILFPLNNKFMPRKYLLLILFVCSWNQFHRVFFRHLFASAEIGYCLYRRSMIRPNKLFLGFLLPWYLTDGSLRDSGPWHDHVSQRMLQKADGQPTKEFRIINEMAGHCLGNRMLYFKYWIKYHWFGSDNLLFHSQIDADIDLRKLYLCAVVNSKKSRAIIKLIWNHF